MTKFKWNGLLDQGMSHPACQCGKDATRADADTHVQNIMYSNELFIPDTIQIIILDCANLDGMCVFEERWKEMDQTHLHAYFGVLILAGVFRSNGESIASLWDAETGR